MPVSNDGRLTVSLHRISMQGPHGIYAGEDLLGNAFEADVDISYPATHPWAFVDYARIREVVAEVIGAQRRQLLEEMVQEIWASLSRMAPADARIRVCLRKMHPPMPGSQAYAQVCLER